MYKVLGEEERILVSWTSQEVLKEKTTLGQALEETFSGVGDGRAD